ncbi:hypothetical protein [Bifidobacterium jacchi]|uniref:Uncharacterized protein n=1 Tax=Bifidobacterium jacchi TaxID=2490545 RepID=A0A5N5RG00_9BIFI|nr:hypothetical protein [Bifidobacterium jacchi]KAB5606169.1 hypothetical protein EHS19_08085 [Bifidobacterium jacchi]
MNLWAYPTLPPSTNGVTFTRDGNGIRVSGATKAGTWAQCNGGLNLAEGVYQCAWSGVNASAIVYKESQSVLSASRPVARLSAGYYQTSIQVGSASTPVTVDETITPVLTLVNP